MKIENISASPFVSVPIQIIHHHTRLRTGHDPICHGHHRDIRDITPVHRRGKIDRRPGSECCPSLGGMRAACADTLEANIASGSAMLYASGVMACVPQVLSEGDEAVGPAGLPFSRMRVLTEQAGFSEIRLVPLEGAANNLYEIIS